MKVGGATRSQVESRVDGWVEIATAAGIVDSIWWQVWRLLNPSGRNRIRNQVCYQVQDRARDLAGGAPRETG